MSIACDPDIFRCEVMGHSFYRFGRHSIAALIEAAHPEAKFIQIGQCNNRQCRKPLLRPVSKGDADNG